MKPETAKQAHPSRQGISRRAVLKGTTALAGLAAGSGTWTGFPTIWAQNIKQVVLRQAGLNVSNMPQFEALVKKELGFSVKMTAIDLPVIINRGLTQPKSLDVPDITYFMLPILWRREIFNPSMPRRSRTGIRSSIFTRLAN